MWKRYKDVPYLGSVHGGDLLEMYGIAGDHLGVDAISMSFIPPPSYIISAIDEGYTSQLHQPSGPQLFEGFHGCEPVVQHHLAQIHPRQQEDAFVQ